PRPVREIGLLLTFSRRALKEDARAHGWSLALCARFRHEPHDAKFRVGRETIQTSYGTFEASAGQRLPAAQILFQRSFFRQARIVVHVHRHALVHADLAAGRSRLDLETRALL